MEPDQHVLIATNEACLVRTTRRSAAEVPERESENRWRCSLPPRAKWMKTARLCYTSCWRRNQRASAGGSRKIEIRMERPQTVSRTQSIKGLEQQEEMNPRNRHMPARRIRTCRRTSFRISIPTIRCSALPKAVSSRLRLIIYHSHRNRETRTWM